MTSTTSSFAASSTSNATADSSDVIYNYNPSHALPIVYAVFFGLALIPHFYYLFSKRARYMIPFVIGVIGEFAGYVFRYFSAKHPLAKGFGILWGTLTQLLIILSPAFLAATHYMIYGRLIMIVGEQYSIIRSRWVTKIFVTLDILSFIIQAVGGSMLSSTPPNVKVGKPVLLVGFLIQISAFGIFAVFGYFYRRKATMMGELPGPWVKVLKVLYAGVITILLRSLYRVIEFGSTNDITGRGYFVDTEAWFYALEATPILICVTIFAVLHPARFMDFNVAKTVKPTPSSEAIMEMGMGSQGVSRQASSVGVQFS